MKRLKYMVNFARRAREAVAAAFRKVKARLPHPDNKVYFGIFAVLLGAAAYFRFWAAPLSAGVDVPQFWAFARVFQVHGLDFYHYADASLDIFPVKGWGFVYPPVWLLLLRLALAATPASMVTSTFIDSGWRLAEKTPIIAADLAIGCLLYWAVPGSKIKKLIIASLWLFHPTAWYNSAVFGQFDAIAAALLLASVILLEKGSDRLAFLIAGLAVMTKQHVLIPVAFMIAASFRRLGWRRLLTDCAILAGVGIVLSLPFLVTGNLTEYARAVVLPGQAPDYQEPLMYSFNGGASLFTYLHQVFGWNTIGYITWSIPVLLLALLGAFILSLKNAITPSRAALVGFLVFISFYYRVNYQYLVIYIPLALWIASRTNHIMEKLITFTMAMLPAVWLWLFQVTFWFYYREPLNLQVAPIMQRIGWDRLGLPDYAYVILALVLMCLFLAYIILVFTRWRKNDLPLLTEMDR